MTSTCLRSCMSKNYVILECVVRFSAPYADQWLAKSSCPGPVWRECAGRICSAASLRPALQVRPAVARRHHWSTTTPSQRPALLPGCPPHRRETSRASGVSVRDGSVGQPHCGHRSKSGQQSLAGTNGAPRRHPHDPPCCRLVQRIPSSHAGSKPVHLA